MWRAPFVARLAQDLEVIAQAWRQRPRLRPGSVWSIGSLRLSLPEFPELTYWFPPQVIAALSVIAAAAHRCQEPHLERVALISLSASIIAKWPHTLSYAMDIDHTRPHRRLQRFTLNRVLTTYVKRLDRTLLCLGSLHQAYHEAGVLETLSSRCHVIYPHDAREPLKVVLDESQALVIATRLGCAPPDLPRLALCLRPRPEHFADDIRQINATFHLDSTALAGIVRLVESIETLAATNASILSAEAGLLMAARTRKRTRPVQDDESHDHDPSKP